MAIEKFAEGAGPGGGLGNAHGPIGSPLEPCPYDAQPNGGPSIKGGDPDGPFGKFKETPNLMEGVARDGLKASPTATGAIETPMSTSSAAMPGLTGSAGTGSTSGGGAKISSPFVSPWGDSAG